MTPLREARKQWGDMNYRFNALGRPLDLPPLHVPAEITLDLDGSQLLWTNTSPTGERAVQLKRPAPDMLDRFIRLTEIPDDRLSKAVLAFAKRFGPLYLCERHGLPSSHNRQRLPDPIQRQICQPSRPSPRELATLRPTTGEAERHRWYAEPIAEWRRLANEALTMLIIAGELREQRRPRSELWPALARLFHEGESEHWPVLARLFNESKSEHWPALARLLREGGGELGPEDMAAQVAALEAAVDVWLQWSAIRTQFVWKSTAPALRHVPSAPYNLFGTLALHVATSISALKGGVYQCANCGEWFPAKRKAVAGRKTYCYKETCGKRAADRDAKRRQRARKEQARTAKA